MLSHRLKRLRKSSHLSQKQFADIFNVSKQAVQKWENGESTPELAKLIRISKYFGLSLDALVMENDNRTVEKMKNTNTIQPHYANIHDWEFFSSALMTEYAQCIDEGLDVAQFQDLFLAVSRLPKNQFKKKMGDVLFELISSASMVHDYPYMEPSELEQIRSLRIPYKYTPNSTIDLEKRIYGAWIGRVCGCMLGQPVECIMTKELIPFLKESGNYPMHRYIYRSDLTEDILNRYGFPFASRVYADEIDGFPGDDDTSYTVLCQSIIEKYGRNFTQFDVAKTWINMQNKNAYCTAERVAYMNIINGFEPPVTAVYQNPYREWIGAQIRGDYFGYINPGDPEMASEMAWRDACISHTKNGIYGEMFVAAMLAVAATTSSVKDIILGGLAQIPHTSRLYKEISEIISNYDKGIPLSAFLNDLYSRFDEEDKHAAVHTIPNAMIVVASLLYGNNDYGKSICISVEAGYDTDCNGATVGSILGMANGIDSIPEYWKTPIKDTIRTRIFGMETVRIRDAVALTMQHIRR